MNATTLFLPGASGNVSFWRPVAERLEGGAQQRFVFCAWPGFGGVPADPSLHSLDDLYAQFRSTLPEGPLNLIAQSMGGVLALRLAIEEPARVRALVLVATSGGIDVKRLGGEDWRPSFVSELPDVPHWFVVDRTDVTDRLDSVTAPTLLLFGDADPISPVAVGEFLRDHIRGARLELVRGGTHVFAAEQPDVVARAIDTFLW